MAKDKAKDKAKDNNELPAILKIISPNVALILVCAIMFLAGFFIVY